jgi:uncharacterized protein (TIGR02271 family)
MAGKAEPPVVEGAVTIPVHQEELRVGTRRVDTGAGVRINKSVTERPVEIDEILRHDELSVTHVPIDRIIAPADAPVSRYEGETLVIPVLEEVLVVERRLRIKEELHITKAQRETRHAETVFLKSEEVSVERFDEASDT